MTLSAVPRAATMPAGDWSIFRVTILDCVSKLRPENGERHLKAAFTPSPVPSPLKGAGRTDFFDRRGQVPFPAIVSSSSPTQTCRKTDQTPASSILTKSDTMQFLKTDLPGVILVEPKVFADERGF